MLDITEANLSRQQIALQNSLLDQIHDAVLTVDKAFRIQYSQCGGRAPLRMVCRGSGSRRAVPDGRGVRRLPRTNARRSTRTSSTAGSWNGEIICTHRAGKKFVVHVSWSVLRDPAGNPVAVVGLHRDLTAPKEMEQALVRESEDRLKLAQSALSLGTWELDLVSDTIECSEQQLRLYGIFEPRERMSFEEWQRILHPDDRADTAGGGGGGSPCSQGWRVLRPAVARCLARWIGALAAQQIARDQR